MTETINELRQRLKKRTAKETIPFKTSMDILIKLNKENFFGFPLIFTTDGQELLTPPILEKEILFFLKGEGANRARISEIARALSVSEDTVMEHVKRIPSLTIFLNDAITEEWFVEKSRELKGMLDSAGELTFVTLAQKFNLSLDLLSTKILSGTNVRFFADKTETSLIGQRHSEIVFARIRGIVHALTVPRDIEWISENAGCSQISTAKNILKQIIRESGISVGAFANETIFIPSAFTKRQGQVALESWTKRGWCDLGMLRSKIGGSKAELSKWLASQQLDESCSVFQTSEFIFRIDKAFSESLLRFIRNVEGTVWVDLKQFLASRSGFMEQLPANEYERFGVVILRKTSEISHWGVCSNALFDVSTIKREISHSVSKRVSDAASRLVNKPSEYIDKEELKLMEKIEALLVDMYGLSREVFPAFPELMAEFSTSIRLSLKDQLDQLSGNRDRPHVKYTLESLSELEQCIAEQYCDFADNFAALKHFRFNTLLTENFKERIIRKFVNSVFIFTALRLCQAAPSFPVELEADRKAILNSLPNFPLIAECKETLQNIESLLTDNPSRRDYGVAVKEKLEDLAILVASELKKRVNGRKYLSGLLVDLEKAEEESSARKIATYIVLSKISGAKVSSILPEFSKSSYALLLTDLKVPGNISTPIVAGQLSELRQLIKEFLDI